LWEKICREVAQKFIGQVWGNAGKNPLHPEILPALTPMKRQLRRRCPLLKGQTGNCPRHASIIRRPRQARNQGGAGGLALLQNFSLPLEKCVEHR